MEAQKSSNKLERIPKSVYVDGFWAFTLDSNGNSNKYKYIHLGKFESMSMFFRLVLWIWSDNSFRVF